MKQLFIINTLSSQSFDTYLLSSNFVLENVLGSEDTAVSKKIHTHTLTFGYSTLLFSEVFLEDISFNPHYSLAK